MLKKKFFLGKEGAGGGKKRSHLCSNFTILSHFLMILRFLTLLFFEKRTFCHCYGVAISQRSLGNHDKVFQGEKCVPFWSHSVNNSVLS